ncbi:hypothetical protein GCM10022206_03910 [Streptomyces chiangmaiensis]
MTAISTRSSGVPVGRGAAPETGWARGSFRTLRWDDRPWEAPSIIGLDGLALDHGRTGAAGRAQVGGHRETTRTPAPRYR